MSGARKPSFDVVKGLACIAVVLIHYNFKNEAGAFVKAACRFAVPAFFMISGWFYCREKVLDRTVRLTKTLLASTLSYGVFSYVLEMIRAHGNAMSLPAFATKYLSAVTLARSLVTNEGLFNEMLWFLGALVCCHFTLACLSSSDRDPRRVCWLTVPLWIMMCVIQEFAKVVGWRWGWTYFTVYGLAEKHYVALSGVYLFRALPFFLFGVWIRRHADSVSVRFRSGPLLPLLAVTGCFLSAFEYWALDHRIAQFYLGSYLSAASLFLWAVAHPDLGWKPLVYLGSRLSLLVYILQLAVGKSVDLVAVRWHLGGLWYNYFYGLLILVLTIGLSWLFVSFGRICRRVRRNGE